MIYLYARAIAPPAIFGSAIAYNRSHSSLTQVRSHSLTSPC
ncbi:hypothetical protein PY364_19255 [Kamptonema sp. UHCC 0994]|nr:hypothetical protein [Kamptonema sp. UHCC 0994]